MPDKIFEDILNNAISRDASDIHLSGGVPPFFRINGKLSSFGAKIPDERIKDVFSEITDEKKKERFLEERSLDFAIEHAGRRFRVNAFFSRGCVSLAIRLIPAKILSLDEIGAPRIFSALKKEANGLIIVAGRTGSGKTTTLASFAAEIATSRPLHIITMEDPVEYVHHSEISLINQREFGSDFYSFPDAIRASLREDPDVIVVGEMRDAQTVDAALSAAETGHLVLTSLHTKTAGEAVLRLESFFPAERQQEIRATLAMVLRAIISQELLQGNHGGRVLATEVLAASPAVRNIIRTGKPEQLPNCILSGSAFHMQTMEQSKKALLAEGKIIGDLL